MPDLTGNVDAAIPLAAKAPSQMNPLQTIGEFANTKNALNQLQLFPGQQALQQQAVQGGAIGLAQHINQATAGAMAPLLASNAPITHKALTDQLAIAEANGIPTGHFVDAIARFPGGDGPDFDQQSRAWILSQAQPTPNAAGVVVPRQGVVDNSSVIQPTLTTAPGLPGQGTVATAGPGFGKGLSPEFLAAQVGRLATPAEAKQLGIAPGTPLIEPMVQRLFNQGVPTTAGRATIPGNGGYPAPTSQPPAIVPPTSPGHAPLVGGLGPTAQADMDASQTQYNQAASAANTFRQRTFALEQAGHALENADTGPGSETVNQIKSFLLAQSPETLKGSLPGVDPNKIQNYDEAVKYLAQYARSQPGAANSDMQSQLAQTANASTHISAQAAQQVVKNTLGLERMQQAAFQQFNEQHPEPGAGQSFNRWMSTEFTPKNDPRGFSWDDQSASQQAAQLKNMGAAEKRRLLNSVNLARQYNFRTGP